MLSPFRAVGAHVVEETWSAGKTVLFRSGAFRRWAFGCQADSLVGTGL